VEVLQSFTPDHSRINRYSPLEHHGRFCTADARKEFFIAHADISRSLWAAVVARPFQFRFLDGLRNRREKLISCGISAEQLMVPVWLNRAASEEGPAT
jgi:hypothetical protein